MKKILHLLFLFIIASLYVTVYVLVINRPILIEYECSGLGESTMPSVIVFQNKMVVGYYYTENDFKSFHYYLSENEYNDLFLNISKIKDKLLPYYGDGFGFDYPETYLTINNGNIENKIYIYGFATSYMNEDNKSLCNDFLDHMSQYYTKDIKKILLSIPKLKDKSRFEYSKFDFFIWLYWIKNTSKLNSDNLRFIESIKYESNKLFNLIRLRLTS